MQEEHDIVKFYDYAVRAERFCSPEAAALRELVLQLRQDQSFEKLEATTTMLSLHLIDQRRKGVYINWRDGQYSIYREHEYHKRLQAPPQEVVGVLKKLLVETWHG